MLNEKEKIISAILKFVIYFIVIAGSIFFFIPFAWTISTALKTPLQVLAFPPQWIPHPAVWRNFIDALTVLPFHLFFMNSGIIVGLAIVGEILSSSLVAFAFARLRFWKRDYLFLLVLSTMMMPFHVLIIPRFIMFKYFGWLNTLKPLIVPHFLGGAFTIFLLRQFFMTIPLELDDAAKIDGCSFFGIYWRMILPLSKPAFGAVAVFIFVKSWKNFLGPLIYLSSQSKYTIPLGLNAFRGAFFIEWNLMMAASLAAIIPPLVIFFITQKYFLRGVALTGSLKG